MREGQGFAEQCEATTRGAGEGQGSGVSICCSGGGRRREWLDLHRVLFEEARIKVFQILFLALQKNLSFHFRTNVGQRLLCGGNSFRDKNEMQAKG